MKESTAQIAGISLIYVGLALVVASAPGGAELLLRSAAKHSGPPKKADEGNDDFFCRVHVSKVQGENGGASHAKNDDAQQKASNDAGVLSGPLECSHCRVQYGVCCFQELINGNNWRLYDGRLYRRASWWHWFTTGESWVFVHSGAPVQPTVTEPAK